MDKQAKPNQDMCEHVWRYIGSKRQMAWECSYCQALRLSEPSVAEQPNSTKVLLECHGEMMRYKMALEAIVKLQHPSAASALSIAITALKEGGNYGTKNTGGNN